MDYCHPIPLPSREKLSLAESYPRSPTSWCKRAWGCILFSKKEKKKKTKKHTTQKYFSVNPLPAPTANLVSRYRFCVPRGKGGAAKPGCGGGMAPSTNAPCQVCLEAAASSRAHLLGWFPFVFR